MTRKSALKKNKQKRDQGKEVKRIGRLEYPDAGFVGVRGLIASELASDHAAAVVTVAVAIAVAWERKSWGDSLVAFFSSPQAEVKRPLIV